MKIQKVTFFVVVDDTKIILLISFQNVSDCYLINAVAFF